MSGPNEPIHIDEEGETVYFNASATENNLRNTFLKKNVENDTEKKNNVAKAQSSRRRQPRRRRTNNVRRRKQIQRKSRKRSLRY